ncbi:hypothetical protein TSOC_006154 [Tetrabaena socialis]|uniref:SET domain-containing protein n=1 Tax=Tetrabaena socialis TaxID=47790 RepID=A0A2J8A4F4_9CHLO|nr:hypothetical protein TSOC_006154 [Tetrabaena socialis]|eukprot:PNH07388.1 hypothetical protein TSOC_006154 [Tetrabaena socialis]
MSLAPGEVALAVPSCYMSADEVPAFVQGCQFTSVPWTYREDPAGCLGAPAPAPHLVYQAQPSRSCKLEFQELHKHCREQGTALKCRTAASTINHEIAVLLVAGHIPRRPALPAHPPPHHQQQQPQNLRHEQQQQPQHKQQQLRAGPAAIDAGHSSQPPPPPLKPQPRPVPCFFGFMLPFNRLLDLAPGRSAEETWLDRRLKERRSAAPEAMQLKAWRQELRACPRDPLSGLPVAERNVRFLGYWDKASSTVAAGAGDGGYSPTMHCSLVRGVMPGESFTYSLRPMKRVGESSALEPVLTDLEDSFLTDCYAGSSRAAKDKDCTPLSCGGLRAREALKQLRLEGCPVRLEVRLAAIKDAERKELDAELEQLNAELRALDGRGRGKDAKFEDLDARLDSLVANHAVLDAKRAELDKRKDLGTFTAEFISNGTYVFEYVGVLRTGKEMAEHEPAYKAAGLHYTYDLCHTDVTKDNLNKAQETELTSTRLMMVDATHIGSVARFVNHRCEGANLTPVNVCGVAVHPLPTPSPTPTCGADRCLGVVFPWRRRDKAKAGRRTALGGLVASDADSDSSSADDDSDDCAASVSSGGGAPVATAAAGGVASRAGACSGRSDDAGGGDVSSAGPGPARQPGVPARAAARFTTSGRASAAPPTGGTPGVSAGQSRPATGGASSTPPRLCSRGAAAANTAAPPRGAAANSHGGAGSSAAAAAGPAPRGSARGSAEPAPKRPRLEPAGAAVAAVAPPANARTGAGSSGGARAPGSGGSAAACSSDKAVGTGYSGGGGGSSGGGGGGSVSGEDVAMTGAAAAAGFGAGIAPGVRREAGFGPGGGGPPQPGHRPAMLAERRPGGTARAAAGGAATMRLTTTPDAACTAAACGHGAVEAIGSPGAAGGSGHRLGAGGALGHGGVMLGLGPDDGEASDSNSDFDASYPR